MALCTLVTCSRGVIHATQQDVSWRLAAPLLRAVLNSRGIAAKCDRNCLIAVQMVDVLAAAHAALHDESRMDSLLQQLDAHSVGVEAEVLNPQVSVRGMLPDCVITWQQGQPHSPA